MPYYNVYMLTNKGYRIKLLSRIYHIDDHFYYGVPDNHLTNDVVERHPSDIVIEEGVDIGLYSKKMAVFYNRYYLQEDLLKLYRDAQQNIDNVVSSIDLTNFQFTDSPGGQRLVVNSKVSKIEVSGDYFRQSEDNLKLDWYFIHSLDKFVCNIHEEAFFLMPKEVGRVPWRIVLGELSYGERSILY